MRSISIFLAAAVLSGCSAISSYERLGSRDADRDYRKISFTFRAKSGEMPVDLFIKVFNDGGVLALCGYYQATGVGSQEALLSQSFASPASTLTIGSTEVGDLSFVTPNPKKRDATDATATCVRTKLPWQDAYRLNAISFTSPPARVSS